MKNPFVILLIAVTVIGIAIGTVATIVLQPSEDSEEPTIPIAVKSELPTPTGDNAQTQSREVAEERPAENASVSIGRPDDLSATDGSETTGSTDQTSSATETSRDQLDATASDGGGGRGRFGGGGGGPNFGAIQEAIETNPELAELAQKAQTGNISQEEQVRLFELMQEAMEDLDFELPGGLGDPPTIGTITEIQGNTIVVDTEDGLSAEVGIGENTNITIIKELGVADLSEGTNVVGVVQRGEDARIYVQDMTIIPEGVGRGFGGSFGGAIGGGAAGTTNLSSVQGTVIEVEGDMVHVETTQGTLRLTVNDESSIVQNIPGALSDLHAEMGVIAFIPEGGTAANVVAGPASFIENTDGRLPGVRRGQGQRRQNAPQ